MERLEDVPEGWNEEIELKRTAKDSKKIVLSVKHSGTGMYESCLAC